MKKSVNINLKFFKRGKSSFALQVHIVTIIFIFASLFVGMFWLLATYLICLIVHEFSHAMVARRLGYKCGKIILYPTGALLCGATDEFGFVDEIKIAVAGPLANLVMIIMSIFVWWIFPESYNYTTDFVVANLSLFLFNMLPIFPLDGGRVLLAFFSLRVSRKQAVAICKNITMVFALMLFAFFIVSCFFGINLQLGIISVVMFISVLGEQKQSAYKRLVKTDLKKRKLLHGLKGSTLVFLQSVPICKVLTKVDNFAYYTIIVVDDNFCTIATLTELMLEKLSLSCPPTTPIGAAIKQISC